MAACGSLRHIFENISENNSSNTSSLIDSLSSWKHIQSLKPPPDHSFTEIFGELHFKENHPNPTSSSSSLSFFPPTPLSSSASAAFPIDLVSQSSNIDNQQDEKSGAVITTFPTNDGYSRPYHRKSDSFSSLNSDSLQLCTEGLGSESLGDVEDLKIEVHDTESHNHMGEKVHVRRHSTDSYCRKIRSNGKTMFPPPIPYIGQTGKPSVSYQSYRQNGRFVLKEVRTPTQECLKASREDGRLRLSFVQPDEDDEEEGNVVEDKDDGEKEEGEGEMRKDEEEEEDRRDGVKEEDEAKVRDDFVGSY